MTHPIIVGVDEAGRGALAGPVVAAAVVLPAHYDIPFLGDSKALSPKRRREAYEAIFSQAIAISIAKQTPTQIDAVNILNATLFAMKDAIEGLDFSPTQIHTVIVDGNKRPYCPEYPLQTQVKADRDVPSVSAASIIAKVTRDLMMTTAHNEYPHYGFSDHAGYGTASHYDAIFKYGPCSLHRKSFNLTKQERLFRTRVAQRDYV